MVDALEFKDYVVSIKDSDPRLVVEANERFAEARPDVPLHLGVTEAGDGEDGRIKSAIGIASLLDDGIGDTVRVSLTEDPVAEIFVSGDGTEHLASSKIDAAVAGPIEAAHARAGRIV